MKTHTKLHVISAAQFSCHIIYSHIIPRGRLIVSLLKATHTNNTIKKCLSVLCQGQNRLITSLSDAHESTI